VPPAAAPAASAQPGTAADPQQVRLVWGSGWKLTVRPVFSGAELAKADGTITVETWENGPATVRYEFPAASSGAVRPEVAALSDGLLRRSAVTGTITVKPDVAHSSTFTPPALWPGGDAAAPGPLLWLAPEVTAALKTNKEATLRFGSLPNGLKMKTTAAEGGGDRRLTIEGHGEIVLTVNGKPTRFPAVRLRDDEGGTYTLIDSPQNPLVVRFRFGEKPVVDGKQLVTGSSSGYDVVALASPTQ
jgi:hypothetical protein